MKKLLLLAAGITGYVLGARAGRERYEQIKDQSTKVWNSPTVQQGVDEASEKAKQAATAAGSKVAEAVKGDSDDGSDSDTDGGSDDEDAGPGPTAPGSPIASPSPAGPPTAADLDPGKP